MAKLFIGIALVVMLASAVLGFMTKDRIAELQAAKQKTKETLNTTEGKLRVKEGELKKSVEDVAAAKTALDEKEKDVTAKAAQIDDLMKKVADANTQLLASQTELAAEKEKNKPVAEGGKPVMDDEVKIALTKRATDAEAALAESKQIQETLNRKAKDAESQMMALQNYKRMHESDIMRPSTSGRVLAVNPGWNFVVLSIGDKQGVVNNSPLLVMRGGQTIAKVRVTSINASTSIADVLPGSVLKGVTVQPGDNVVFEGGRNQPRKTLAPSGPGAAPETPASPALPSITH